MAGNMFQVSNQINLEAARVGFHAAFLQQLEVMGDDEIDALYAMVTSTGTLEEWDWRGAGPVECAIVRRDDDDVAAGATRPLSG
jgi:hypothetical protein